MNNCVFHSIISNEPVVKAEIHVSSNKVISFNNCTFKNNYATFVVSIIIDKFTDFACQDSQIATFPPRPITSGGFPVTTCNMTTPNENTSVLGDIRGGFCPNTSDGIKS